MQRIGDRQFLQLVDDLRALAHAGGVEQLDLVDLAVLFPLPVDANRIARDPGLGARNQPVFADHAVDQRRLARIRTADDRQLHRAQRRVLILFAVRQRKGFGPFGAISLDDRAERIKQIDHAFAMFGAQCDRIVEAKRIALHQAVFALFPLRLVDEKDDRRVLAAQPARDFLVERGHARAAVDHEKRGIGLAHRLFGLDAHPAG